MLYLNVGNICHANYNRAHPKPYQLHSETKETLIST